MYIRSTQSLCPVKTHTHTHTLRFLIFGWTVPLRPLTLTLKALNTLLRPRLRVAPGQKHYSEVKVIWVQNVCWRESLLNPHTIHQKKTNPTFSIGWTGFFQFLLETTQLATTIVLASFQHVITLNFSIRSVQIIRSALLSFLSAVHSGGVSLNITMSWQAQWKICGFDHEDGAQGTILPVPSQAVRGREKRKARFSLWIIEALWVSVKREDKSSK